MTTRLIAALILASSVSQAALAQIDPDANQPPPSLGAESSPHGSHSQEQSAARSPDRDAPQSKDQSLPEELRQQLSSYGFSDVKVKPDSYIVTAKKDGQTLVLWLTPDTATVLAEESSEEDTVGSGANSPNPKNPTSFEKNLVR